MNRIPIADWAGQAPWSGITGKPSWIGTTAPVVDLGDVTWNGTPANRIPQWNGKKFIPTTIASGSGTKIKDGDQPAMAVRRRPPGNPTASFEDVWQRFVFNVRLYGATGTGVDDLQAINAAIADLNAAGMGMLYFPAGRYRCSAPPDRITGFSLIKGDGIGVTVLSFGGSDGITFDPSSSESWVGASDLAMEEVGTAFMVRGGSARFTDLGIECSAQGLSFGLTGTAVDEALVSHAYFISANNSAVAITGRTDLLQANDIQILGSGASWARGINLLQGQDCDLHDIFISNCSGEAILLGTSVSHSRIHDILFTGILAGTAVLDHGTGNYVNELMGLGGNTDTRFDNRKELYSLFSWAPGTIAPGYGYYDDFSVPSARFGDQCVLGAPYLFDPGVSSDLRVVGSDTVRALLYNLGTTTVDLVSGIWKMRIFN